MNGENEFLEVINRALERWYVDNKVGGTKEECDEFLAWNKRKTDFYLNYLRSKNETARSKVIDDEIGRFEGSFLSSRYTLFIEDKHKKSPIFFNRGSKLKTK